MKKHSTEFVKLHFSSLTLFSDPLEERRGRKGEERSQRLAISQLSTFGPSLITLASHPRRPLRVAFRCVVRPTRLVEDGFSLVNSNFDGRTLLKADS